MNLYNIMDCNRYTVSYKDLLSTLQACTTYNGQPDLVSAWHMKAIIPRHTPVDMSKKHGIAVILSIFCGRIILTCSCRAYWERAIITKLATS